MWPRVRDDKLFVSLIGGLIVLAWVSLWLWQESPYGRFLSHHAIEHVRAAAPAPPAVHLQVEIPGAVQVHVPGSVHVHAAEHVHGADTGYLLLLLLFGAGWTLMTVAMMLPT